MALTNQIAQTAHKFLTWLNNNYSKSAVKSRKMAARNVEPMVITEEEYFEIFGESDSEEGEEKDFESDIDVSVSSSEEEDSVVEGSEEEDSAEEGSVDRVAWTTKYSNIVVDPFVSQSGKNFVLPNNCKEIDVFSVLFTDQMLEEIVRESNLYACQKLGIERFKKFSEITLPEFKAFLGICIIMGINTLPKTADYWSSDPFLGNEGIKRTMTKNRFEELSRFLHFNDSEQEPLRTDPNYDRLYKIRPVLEYFNSRMLEVYHPGQNISVDEAMIAFKGRLSFRQYMPKKPTKFGIKVWVAADASNGFAVNHKVYLGRDGERSEEGLGYDVVTGLIQPFVNKNHHVYFDNFFCGVKLLEDLLDVGTYACGTVRVNRKGLPAETSKKLKKGEKVVVQKGISNVVFTKWHDKRDVSLLSTNCGPEEPMVVIERRKKNGEIVCVEKPKSISLYNNNMGGVDRSDQLRSYYNSCRISRKWYKYIFFFIFELIIGNSHLLHREHSKQSLKDFRLALAKQLIGGFSNRACHRKRVQKAAELSPCVSPPNSPGHFVSKREGRKRQCIQCKRAGRKTTSQRARETIYGCAQCDISLCKDGCFAEYHSQF